MSEALATVRTAGWLARCEAVALQRLLRHVMHDWRSGLNGVSGWLHILAGPARLPDAIGLRDTAVRELQAGVQAQLTVLLSLQQWLQARQAMAGRTVQPVSWLAPLQAAWPTVPLDAVEPALAQRCLQADPDTLAQGWQHLLQAWLPEADDTDDDDAGSSPELDCAVSVAGGIVIGTVAGAPVARGELSLRQQLGCVLLEAEGAVVNVYRHEVDGLWQPGVHALFPQDAASRENLAQLAAARALGVGCAGEVRWQGAAPPPAVAALLQRLAVRLVPGAAVPLGLLDLLTPAGRLDASWLAARIDVALGRDLSVSTPAS